MINILCFGIAILTIFFIILYEKFFKNQGLTGNAVVAFLSATSFIFGGASVGQLYNTFVPSMIAFLLVLGREILMDVRDMDGDKIGRVTLPMKIGRKPAIYIGCIFLAVAISLTPLPTLLGILGVWYILIIIPTDFFLAYAIISSLMDVRNVGKTANMVRMGMAVGLIGFIIGMIP